MGPAFAWEVAVMKITVAARLTALWLPRCLGAPARTDLAPTRGLCEGAPTLSAPRVGPPVDTGPRDLRQIPEYSRRAAPARDYGGHDLDVVAAVVAGER